MSEAPRTTENQSYTPGPWSCEQVWPIPETRIHTQVHGRPYALAEVFTMLGTGERQANARLIAAAPDLLEALKLLAQETKLSGNWNAKDYGWPKAIAATIAAITKAEGRDYV